MTTRKIQLVAVFVFSLFLFVPAVRAEDSGEFATSIRSRYRVHESGETEVSHEVRLTNLNPLLFVSEYTMTIAGADIKNIRALDDVGTLPVVRSSTRNTTTVLVNLESRPQFGIGKTKTLTILYTSSDIASVVGSVLEVNVPGIRDATSLSSSQVTVETPTAYGQPTRVTPNPGSTEKTDGWTSFAFTDTKNEGISLIFGSFQLFSVQLSYTLTNSTDTPLRKSLTLIPDTSTQRVTIRTISPTPFRVTSDEDGNWLAEYELSPHRELRVNADLIVETFMNPTIPVTTGLPEKYLRAAPFWDVDDERIRSLAQSLKTPSAIFQYVATRLTYSFSRVTEPPQRRGALEALKNPSDAICTEFTDLFIALARAAGIPARELNGYAYSQNPTLRPLSLTKDILHAWPEYWNAEVGRWISVDPTWTNTTGGVDYFSKLDVNHIVFAIHGSSSTDPLPAGFFKSDEGSGKSVFVAPLTAKIARPEPRVILELSSPNELPSYRSSTVLLRVRNQGSQALYELPVSIKHRFRTVQNPPQSIPVILPGEEQVLAFTIKPSSWWNRDETPLTVTIGDTYETFTLTSSLRVNQTIVVGLLVLFAGATSIGAALRAWRLHIS